MYARVLRKWSPDTNKQMSLMRRWWSWWWLVLVTMLLLLFTVCPQMAKAENIQQQQQQQQKQLDTVTHLTLIWPKLRRKLITTTTTTPTKMPTTIELKNPHINSWQRATATISPKVTTTTTTVEHDAAGVVEDSYYIPVASLEDSNGRDSSSSSANRLMNYNNSNSSSSRHINSSRHISSERLNSSQVNISRRNSNYYIGSRSKKQQQQQHQQPQKKQILNDHWSWPAYLRKSGNFNQLKTIPNENIWYDDEDVEQDELDYQHVETTDELDEAVDNVHDTDDDYFNEFGIDYITKPTTTERTTTTTTTTNRTGNKGDLSNILAFDAAKLNEKLILSNDKRPTDIMNEQKNIYKQQQQQPSERIWNVKKNSTSRLKSRRHINEHNSPHLKPILPYRYIIDSHEVPPIIPYNGELTEQQREQQIQQATRNRRDSRTFGIGSSSIGGLATDGFTHYYNKLKIPMQQQQQQQQQQPQQHYTFDDYNNHNNNNYNYFHKQFSQPLASFPQPPPPVAPPLQQQQQQHYEQYTPTRYNNNQHVQQPYYHQHQHNQQQTVHHHQRLQHQQQQQQHHHHQYQQQQQQHRKHHHQPRRYCSARDPAQLAFEAPTVFEGKIVSMTPDRRANFSATVEVKEVYKQQIGSYRLQKYLRLQFAYRNTSSECDIYREQLRARGLVRGDELEQGRIYFMFVQQIDLGIFTILGQPMR